MGRNEQPSLVLPPRRAKNVAVRISFGLRAGTLLGVCRDAAVAVILQAFNGKDVNKVGEVRSTKRKSATFQRFDS